MDGVDLAALVETGQWLLSDKRFMNAMHFLWVYDYFLTLGDEITYAWSGMRSQIFVLFAATRYSPVLYLVWVNLVMFHYTDCEATKWGLISITVIVTALAQTAVALRIYAITDRNKLFGGALSVVITTQLVFGTYYIAQTAMGPTKPMPEIDLDAYKVCFSGQWRVGGLVFTSLGIAFDIFAFSIIVVRVRRSGMRFIGIPNLLDTILQDATVYFVLLFACQLCLLLFVVLASVRKKFTPGVANTIFTPIMASRLMLSLKKASVAPMGLWSLETMSAFSEGELKEDEIIHFPSPTLGVDNRIPEALNRSTSHEGDVEFESMQNTR